MKHKTIMAIIDFPRLIFICVVGTIANYMGWERLDQWCQRQL